MPASHLNDPEYWRGRAKQARAMVEPHGRSRLQTWLPNTSTWPKRGRAGNAEHRASHRWALAFIKDKHGAMAVKLGRKFCGQKCQREHRRFPRVYSVFASGSYTPSAEHRSDSKSAHSTGLKTRLRVVRGSGDPAVEHRIGPDDYPVNILGGHRWPYAPKLGSTIETVLWNGPHSHHPRSSTPPSADRLEWSGQGCAAPSTSHDARRTSERRSQGERLRHRSRKERKRRD